MPVQTLMKKVWSHKRPLGLPRHLIIRSNFYPSPAMLFQSTQSMHYKCVAA